MVQVNEIRIGNLIKSSHIHEAKTKQIKHINTQVNPSVVFYEDSVVGDYIKDIEPIPLTPEILEKCGFVENGYGGGAIKYINGYFIKLEHEYPQYKVSKEVGAWYTRLCEISYLHQLQNLFYCLSGTELTVNL